MVDLRLRLVEKREQIGLGWFEFPRLRFALRQFARLFRLPQNVFDSFEGKRNGFEIRARSDFVDRLDAFECVGWVVAPDADHCIDFIVWKAALLEYESKAVFVELLQFRR